MSGGQACANTDREIWRKGDGDGNGMSYYEPSIHVTEQGSIGINVGGNVFVKPVEEWHRLAKEAGGNGNIGVIPTPPPVPKRVVLGANGAYWRVFELDGEKWYSMAPNSIDNDPVEPVAVFVLDPGNPPTSEESRG